MASPGWSSLCCPPSQLFSWAPTVDCRSFHGQATSLHSHPSSVFFMPPFFTFFFKIEIQFPFHALQLKALHPLITHVHCFGLNFPLCFLEKMMSLVCFIFMWRKALLKFWQTTFTTSYSWINWKPIKHMKGFGSQKTDNFLLAFVSLAPAVSICKVKHCLDLLELPPWFSTNWLFQCSIFSMVLFPFCLLQIPLAAPWHTRDREVFNHTGPAPLPSRTQLTSPCLHSR